MSFDPPTFLRRVAARLVFEFDGAAAAGTPGLIGAAREHPARVQLEKLLPGGVGVGSGIVIDSYGSTSKQQDIVIFDKHICPVFSINDAPEATYYPIEGVIAVGEVKSSLDATQIEDSVSKISSVKRLQRFSIAEADGLGLPPSCAFRKYGATMSMTGTESEEYSQETKSLDQVFGFVLCGKFSLKPQSILERFSALVENESRGHSPNFLLSLNDGYLMHYRSETNSITRSAMEGDGVVFSGNREQAFPQLLWFLDLYIRSGRTVPVRHFDRYFRAPDSKPTSHEISALVKVARP